MSIRSLPRRASALAVFGLLCTFTASANVSLPAIFGDHMMFQRGVPVHVWGKAAPSETVKVTFHGNTGSTTADSLGLWSVFLPAVDAGGPFELTVEGQNSIHLSDILVGDVWVASGQSNMEFSMHDLLNADQEIARANHEHIRLFKVDHIVAEYPMDDLTKVQIPWTRCEPAKAAGFSAAAYFFALQIHQKTGVPVGIIESAWGGTPADAWTSLTALSADASLMPVFSEWAKMTVPMARTRVQWQRRVEAWQKEADAAKAAGKPAPNYPWEPNIHNSWEPAGLYNAMIAPLTPFGVKGFIWYQGESNAGKERAPLYNRLFETMIRDWRSAWGLGDLPFLFVQLTSYKTGENSDWPALREAQRQTLSLTNTGMAVIIDIGDPHNIHPKNKQDVGLRLSLAARAIAYGEKIEYSGPAVQQVTSDGASLRVWFDHAAGLTAKGGAPATLEVAGIDGKFAPAEATIEGSTLVVHSDAVKAPVQVRYGWSDVPPCNLFNSDNLPASPFWAHVR